jgi:hypothetical protein
MKTENSKFISAHTESKGSQQQMTNSDWHQCQLPEIPRLGPELL